MSKKILSIISAITIFMAGTFISSAAPEQWGVSVIWSVYRNGQVTPVKNLGAENIEDINVPLFQLRDDNLNSFRPSDGYCFSCDTTIDITGMTRQNSVMIQYHNPVIYNGGLQTLAGARNRLYVVLTHSDGTEQEYYYGSLGIPDTAGDAPLLQLGEYGTCEFEDDICLTLIKGVAVDRIRISVELYADSNNPAPIPMSAFTDGSVTFGNVTYMEQLITDVKEDTGKIVQQMDNITSMTPSDRNDVNNMQSNIANKQEQSGQLVEDIQVNKPTISDDMLNPMDRVDGTALNEMGGLIGAIFTSPTLGSIATMTLVFALIGYIMYGKKE